MRVVICWELGSGLGHVANFWPLAKALRRRGHSVDFILKDVSHAQLLLPLGSRILQAPLWRGERDGGSHASYPEILMRRGYASGAGLLYLGRAWVDLFDYLKPELVIADYAPTAMLAARAYSGAKVVSIGSGFFVPPLEVPLPSFRIWESVDDLRLRIAEHQVLANCNAVLKQLNAPGLNVLADLVRGDGQLLVTWPELDHYGKRADARYWGPAVGIPGGAAPEWPGSGEARVFAYLKPAHAPERIVEVLKKWPVSALVAVPGLRPRDADAWSNSRVRIEPKAINAAQAISEAAHVICHAGAATVAQALIAGRPVMAVPTNAEQYSMSMCAAATGAGVVVAQRGAGLDLDAGIRELLTDKQYQTAAGEFATRYRHFDVESAAERMAVWCENLDGSTANSFHSPNA